MRRDVILTENQKPLPEYRLPEKSWTALEKVLERYMSRPWPSPQNWCFESQLNEICELVRRVLYESGIFSGARIVIGADYDEYRRNLRLQFFIGQNEIVLLKETKT